MRNIFVLVILLPVFAFAETKFSNESEVSIVQTGGNSTVETYNAKTLSKWEKAKRSYSLGGHYTLGTSEQTDETTGDTENAESARNWDVNLKYDQKLTKTIDGFAAIQYEGDKFAGYNQRENLDVGLKHIMKNTDKLKTFIEAGARYTIERRVERNEDNEDVLNFTKGRLYYEISHQKNESLSYKFWVEYLPNFTEAQDYMISYEPSIAFVLDGNFSLKTAYKAIYDNEPNVEGNEYTDYTFTTSLLAKF